MTFEPRIVSFLCNWCAYAGADLAGTSRIPYPTNVRIIRVMCSGRVDPVIILETLAQGADGVIVMGCHPGDCHYVQGNLQAERKIKMLKKLIAWTGLEPERLRLEWVSASEGARFAEVTKDFTTQVMKLGPSPLAGEKLDPNLLERMLAAKAAAEDFRLRVLVGRERELVEEENVYGEKKPQEEFDRVMHDAVRAEYLRNRMYLMTQKEPLSVKELAKRLDMDPGEALRHVVVLRRRGLMAVDRIEGTSPLYTALEAK
ncbi:hydrogenase iron-sulfur subunit [Candidatus Bathyarchaeota archaeon]|nr:hydrogenase iron-sulfur subunit [Candidatus Bathyarchaeota archaeon]